MKRVVVAVALVAACRAKHNPDDYETISLKKDLNPAVAVRVIPATTRQLVTGVIDDANATKVHLQLWSRAPGGAWTAPGDAWRAVIGSSGAAWGIGLHGANVTPAKREGDLKSPSGAFRIAGSYGYAAAPPDGTKLPYTRSDKLECVDDPMSLHYARIVDGSRGERDWKSSEQMRRSDDLYTWVIDIAHNAGHAPGSGSCIFFHVWSGPESTTEGCTAMPADKLAALMQSLDPALEPVYVLLPRSEYKVYAVAWDLPPQP